MYAVLVTGVYDHIRVSSFRRFHLLGCVITGNSEVIHVHTTTQHWQRRHFLNEFVVSMEKCQVRTEYI